jgi:hypothetical protein
MIVSYARLVHLRGYMDVKLGVHINASMWQHRVRAVHADDMSRTRKT